MSTGAMIQERAPEAGPGAAATPTPGGPGRLWDLGDLCERWGVSEEAARRLLRRWSVPTIKLSGKVVRFRPGDIEAAERRAALVEERKREAVR